MDPYISVIIPVRNDQLRLLTCVASLRQQTYAVDRFEVIIVDNGSETGVAIPPSKLDVRVVREAGPSSYAARNRGVVAARGEILAFTDCDCIPTPTWLSCAVDALARRGPNVAVGGAIEVFPEDPARPTPTELYEMACAFPQDLVIARQRFAVTANLIIPRQVLDHVGRFNAALASGGDTEWGRRAFASGVKLVFAPDVVVRHPARRQFAELARKARRTIGGAHDQGLNRLTDLPRAIAPPVLSIARILRSRHLEGIRQRMAAVAIAFCLKYTRLAFRLAFLMGLRRRWR